MPEYFVYPDLARIIRNMEARIKRLEGQISNSRSWGAFSISGAGGFDGFEDVTTVAYNGIKRFSGRKQNESIKVHVMVTMRDTAASEVTIRLVTEDPPLTIAGPIIVTNDNTVILEGLQPGEPGDFNKYVLEGRRPNAAQTPNVKVIACYGIGPP